MSVILDALRRTRADSDERRASERPRTRAVPAALGFGVSASESRDGRHRSRWLAVLAGVALVVLTGIVVRGLIVPRPEPQRAVAPSTPRPASVRPSSPAPRADANVAPPSAVGSVQPTPTAERKRVVTPQNARSPKFSEFDLAVRYHNLGRFEPARDHYLGALAADEFNAEARNNLGLLYYEHQRPDEAIKQFRQATRIRPDYVKARNNLAVVLTSLGRLPEARSELRAAMQQAPGSADVLVNMALVDKAGRNPDAAMEWLNRALTFEPTHALAHYNLAVLYDEAGLSALASEHYRAFLASAMPDQGPRLEQVERRLRSLSEAPSSPSH